MNLNHKGNLEAYLKYPARIISRTPKVLIGIVHQVYEAPQDGWENIYTSSYPAALRKRLVWVEGGGPLSRGIMALVLREESTQRLFSK